MDFPRPSRSSKVRLQRYLARCGIGSRRACEQLIAAGRVTVNGRPVTRQGVCVDEQADLVRLDGRICRPEQRIVILINKPRGVLCTCRDPQGRRTFRDLLPDPRARLYPVGRLDRDSEGLLIVTNDGELAQALAHPRHEVPKVYHATVRSAPSREQMQRLREGVLADGRLLKAETIEPMGRQRDETEYRIVLREGHKRQIRRMFDAVGVRVVRLQRVAIGPLNMGGLRPGQWRHMTQAELTLLRRPPENRDGDAGRI